MRILLLNHFIQNFTGSEINAVQLCEALGALGHEAHIGTLIYKPPLRDYVSEKAFRIINLLEEPGELAYDLVWAHHAPVLAYLLFKKQISDTRLIFSSLSPILPLEAPPIFVHDIHYYLSLSELNARAMIQAGVPAERIHIFPNYAPGRFFSLAKTAHPESPRKIAVISNHPPEEVRTFADMARSQGVEVDFWGAQDKITFVDAELLLNYDLVLTIGKTTQYCFALKIPVYSYDHYGGFGYINHDSYDRAKPSFAGRLCNIHRTSAELFADIFDNYPANLANLDFFYNDCQQNYCLETNLQHIASQFDAIPVTNIQAFRQKNTLAERAYDAYFTLLEDIFSLQKIIQEKDREKQALLSAAEAEREATLSAKNAEIQALTAAYEDKQEQKIPHPGSLQKSGIFSRLVRRGRSFLNRIFKKTQNKRDHAQIKASTLFDASWYLRQYPDVAATGMDPAWHYLLHGGLEGRDPGPYFSTAQYLQAHPDLQTTRTNPLLHYLQSGIEKDTA